MKVCMALCLLAFVVPPVTALSAATPEGAENASAPRNDAWKVIGMGGGGTMQHPLISPHDPDLILNACDMTGSYISRDGGDSWRMFNLRTGTSCFAFDPTDENVIYGANRGLFRSTDKGVTWELVFPDVTRNTFEYRRGDHGDYGLESDDERLAVDQERIAVHDDLVGVAVQRQREFGGCALHRAPPAPSTRPPQRPR